MEHPRSILQTSLFSLEGIRDFGCWILDLWTWLYFSRILSEDSKIENGPIAQSRLERTPDKREVVGSIPTRPTNWIDDFILRDINPKIENPFGGCSSVGRAPALHAGGHRFDPVHLHQNRFKVERTKQKNNRTIKSFCFEL